MSKPKGGLGIIYLSIFYLTLFCSSWGMFSLGYWMLSNTVFSLLIIAVTVVFVYFLTSFSTRRSRRHTWMVLVFIFTNIYAIIFVYASIYYLNQNIRASDAVSGYAFFWECVYFSTVTITTVGFGDFHPFTFYGRVFVSSEAILGYIVLGLTISALTNILSSRKPANMA